jgi:uncharacterized protein YkwD
VEKEESYMHCNRVRLLVSGLSLLVSLALVSASEPNSAFRLSPEEQKLLDLTNAERKEAKLAPVVPNPLLFKVARAHSANMARQEKCDHYLDGKKPRERVTESGYKWRFTGENLAYGDVDLEDVMKGWMASPKHRDNIVKSEYTEIGLGLARGENGITYYTQVFATPPRPR